MITRSTRGGHSIQTCCFPLSRRIKHCWDVRGVWWRQMLHSSLPRTRPPRRRRGSNASAFPIAQPKASNASASRESAGSVTARNGAPDPRDASASPGADTASAAAATKAMSECTAGSASASSPTTSSTSGAPWKNRQLLKPSRHRQVCTPAGHPWRALPCHAQLTTMPQTSILRREVASGERGQLHWAFVAVVSP